MNSLFGKVIMLVGALAASASFTFWSIYKGSLSLEIFSTMTPDQAVGFTKLFAAITLITIMILFVMFLGRPRSKG